MARSRSTRSHAWLSASYISHVSAFLASGRLNVSVAISFSTVNRVEDTVRPSLGLNHTIVLEKSLVMFGFRRRRGHPSTSPRVHASRTTADRRSLGGGW